MGLDLHKACSYGILYAMKHLLLLSIFLCLIACQSEEQQAKTLVTQLGAKDVALRTEAMKSLIAMGDSAIDALISGVSSEDSQVREMSVWTLSEIKTPVDRIVPAIITSLTDSEETIRVVGSVALQSLGEPAVPYLIDALRAPSAEIRLNVAYALGEIGTPLDTIIPALIDTLTDPVWNVRRLVVRALIRIGPPAVEPLTQALTSPDQDLRRMAERALNDMGTRQSLRAIADAKKRTRDR